MGRGAVGDLSARALRLDPLLAFGGYAMPMLMHDKGRLIRPPTTEPDYLDVCVLRLPTTHTQ